MVRSDIKEPTQEPLLRKQKSPNVPHSRFLFPEDHRKDDMKSLSPPVPPSEQGKTDPRNQRLLAYLLVHAKRLLGGDSAPPDGALPTPHLNQLCPPVTSRQLLLLVVVLVVRWCRC